MFCVDSCFPCFILCQILCVSQATHLLVLTGVQTESFSQENIKLRMDVQHDSGDVIFSGINIITGAIYEGQCM